MTDSIMETYNIDETFFYDYSASPSLGVDLIASKFTVEFHDIAVTIDGYDVDGEEQRQIVEDSY